MNGGCAPHGIHGSCGTCALLDAIATLRALLGGAR